MCLFTRSCQATHERVEAAAACGVPPSTLVTLEWDSALRLFNGLDAAGHALALAVQKLFPALYASAQQREAEERWLDGRWRHTQTEIAVNEALQRISGVTPGAARSILRACAAGRAPALSELPAAERIHQLALALDPEQLVIELVVYEAERPPDGALYAFGKGAQWLARNSGARVLMVLREELAASGELDAISYGAYHDTIAEALPLEQLPPSAAEVAVPDTDSEPELPAVSVGAVIGRPHPGSPAEIALHQRLTRDAELRPLFQYNQLVRTRFGTTPRIDVVWPEGRLAIEIDGFPDHARRAKFYQDRERDYQLLVSGYRVLRISDAHVLQDTDLVVEKVRTAVHLVREESHGL